MEYVGIMTSKDVDMDEDDTLDLEYDELALGPNKRRRKGSGSCNFSFTSCSSNVEFGGASQCPSLCPFNSDDTKADKSKLTTTLRFQCLVPAAKIRECQASIDKSHGRAHSFCHRYGTEVHLGPVHGERTPIMGFPASVDRDKYKKWICKNDLYEFRTSKYHQTTKTISFLERLRAAQAASACTSSHSSEI